MGKKKTTKKEYFENVLTIVPFFSLTLPFPLIQHHGVISKDVRHTTEFDNRVTVPQRL